MRSAAIILFSLLLSCSNEFNGKNGVKTTYFPGTKRIFQTIEYQNGLKNGSFREYFKNGKIKTEHRFVNDTLNDTSFTYHENGKLALIQVLKMGSKEGIWKKYNKEGHLYSEISMKDGELDGPSIIYTYRSGKVLKRVNYKDGDQHGKQEIFYNNGKPESVMYFHYNNPCVGTEEWDQQGKKIKNDFAIKIEEQDKVLMEGTLRFLIRLENPQEDDEMYEMGDRDTGSVVTRVISLPRKGNYFLLERNVSRGGYVMEKIRVAAFRKTRKGNTVIKIATVNASANNY